MPNTPSEIELFGGIAPDGEACEIDDSVGFPLPSATEVRLESRLHPEQLRADMEGYTQMDDEIGRRLKTRGIYVLNRLMKAASPVAWPFGCSSIQKRFGLYSQANCDRFNSNQTEQAALAVKFLTLGDLMRSAGQGSEYYQGVANSYFADAENVLKALEMSIQDVAGSDSPSGIGVFTLTTGRGNYDDRLREVNSTMP